jgi:hypothetical protein
VGDNLEDISALALSPQPVFTGVGCVGPRAVCGIDTVVYWMSDRGPYRTANGGAPEFLGGALGGKTLMESLLPQQLLLCAVGTDGDVVRFAGWGAERTWWGGVQMPLQEYFQGERRLF